MGGEACDELYAAIQPQNGDKRQYVSLKKAGEAALNKIKETKAHPTFNAKYLPHLTEHLKAATVLVQCPTPPHIAEYKRYTKEIVRVKRDWGAVLINAARDLL